jgi:hypothetical protein
MGMFSCCQKVNCIQSNEVDIDSNNQKVEENEEDEKRKITNNNIIKSDNKSNHNPVQNFLLNQSNSELYNNFLKNNISLDKNNLSLNNINNLNLDKTQKILNNQDDFNNFSNKVINNNIINNNIIKITNNNNFLNMNQKDFGYVSFCAQSNINKSTKSLIKHIKAKSLTLSGHLFFNQNIKITNNGIEKSLRNKNEFPIFFGTEPTVDKDGIPYNDFILNFTHKKKFKKKSSINDNKKENNESAKEIVKEKKNKDIDDKEKDIEKEKDNDNIIGGRIFQIMYDKLKNEYILTFIHNSLILYYRINNPIYFDYDKEYYFILGNVFLSILAKKIDDKNNICIKVETEDQKAEKINYENKKKIIIGRGKKSDVEIDKQCISKLHSIIEYDHSLNQYFYRDNNSTNGSTLLIREDDSIIIKGSMYFKLEDTSFIIKEIE